MRGVARTAASCVVEIFEVECCKSKIALIEFCGWAAVTHQSDRLG